MQINYRCKPVVCIETGQFFASGKDATLAYGKSVRALSVRHALNGMHKYFAGLTWRYATVEEIENAKKII